MIFTTVEHHEARSITLMDEFKKLDALMSRYMKSYTRTIKITYSDASAIKNSFNMLQYGGIPFVHIKFIDVPEIHEELYEFVNFQRHENFTLLKKENPGVFFNDVIFKKDITMESGDFEISVTFTDRDKDPTIDYIEVRFPDYYKTEMNFKINVVIPDTPEIRESLKDINIE